MASSLVPERPLLISPTLAATIGLEETVMLHVISELQLRHQTHSRDQRHWFRISEPALQEALPFWQPDKFALVMQSLIDKGLLLSETTTRGWFQLAINQKSSDEAEYPAAATAKPATPVSTSRKTETSADCDVFKPSRRGQASTISADWQPDAVLYQQCESQHGIPASFIDERLPSFVIAQSERRAVRYSWHNEFLKWIVKQWQQEKSYKGAREMESRMSRSWEPSEEAVSILEHAGIAADFIADCVPEFVLYWLEMKVVNSAWNTKFIQHVRRQWAKFSAEVGSDNTPCLVPSDFKPSDACYEVLGMANIDEAFAREQIPEFILFWQERGEATASWNTKFLQHVKYRWANRAQAHIPANEQVQNTISRMTDRSWAD